jgi:hypothetical protein
MSGELVQLAQVAGQTVVAAAATDAWGKAKAGLGRLLGRGDLARVQVAERRLEDMRGQLAAVSGAELKARQATAAAASSLARQRYGGDRLDQALALPIPILV